MLQYCSRQTERQTRIRLRESYHAAHQLPRCHCIDTSRRIAQCVDLFWRSLSAVRRQTAAEKSVDAVGQAGCLPHAGSNRSPHKLVWREVSL